MYSQNYSHTTSMAGSSMRLVRMKPQGPGRDKGPACPVQKKYKIIQNKRYFTSTVTIMIFILYFIRILPQKKVPNFPEMVKFQPKCTEFHLRLGLHPRLRCFVGAHIAPMPPAIFRGGEGRKGEGKKGPAVALKPQCPDSRRDHDPALSTSFGNPAVYSH